VTPTDDTEGDTRADEDPTEGLPGPRPRRRRVRESLLWGVVGALVFLVGLQAHHLLGGRPADMSVAVGAALGVGVGATVATYALAPHVRRKGRT